MSTIKLTNGVIWSSDSVPVQFYGMDTTNLLTSWATTTSTDVTWTATADCVCFIQQNNAYTSRIYVDNYELSYIYDHGGTDQFHFSMPLKTGQVFKWSVTGSTNRMEFHAFGLKS